MNKYLSKFTRTSMALAVRLASRKQREHSTQLFVTQHVTQGSTEMPSMTITNKHSCQCAFKAFKNTFWNKQKSILRQTFNLGPTKSDVEAPQGFHLELMSRSSVSWSRGRLRLTESVMLSEACGCRKTIFLKPFTSTAVLKEFETQFEVKRFDKLAITDKPTFAMTFSVENTRAPRLHPSRLVKA